MLFRLSLKLARKTKVGQLAELPLDDNPFADWSCHVFNVGRTQFLIVTNTRSLYSCLLPGAGITNGDVFVERSFLAIREFLEHDQQIHALDKLAAVSASTPHFAKALSRSITGSMNDLIFGAKLLLGDGVDRLEAASRLNKTPLSALSTADGRNYANPREVLEEFMSERHP